MPVKSTFHNSVALFPHCQTTQRLSHEEISIYLKGYNTERMDWPCNFRNIKVLNTVGFGFILQRIMGLVYILLLSLVWNTNTSIGMAEKKQQ